MDLTTLIGFAGIWALVALAIILGGVGFGPYIDIPSVVIVIGGTAAIVAAQFEGSDLKRIGKAMGVAFKPTPFEPLPELVEKIIFYATEIKKHGVMQIEQKILEEKNPFFKEAFQLLVDGSKPDLIEPLLESKMEQVENRHKPMLDIFNAMGGVAGAMGMIGTLIGLVAMLANLSDPAAVGPAMAVALLTTLYGALVGNAVGGIFEKKLANKHNVEMNVCAIIIKGVCMIAAEESIGNIKMKLNAVLQEVKE